ncbi:hypothetical protein [Arenibaculum pallidiluteum]|uniref:hypothetical protein n=1 Tax=Arenibaculum pallidiluteum TaxID=2812559 RepID=UPI001A969F8A|nr:hypothetical protein [Arenibaculum pallidiluteum]
MADEDSTGGQGSFVPGSGHTAPPSGRTVDSSQIPGVRPPTGPDAGDIRSDGHGGNPDSAFKPGEGGEGEVESWHEGRAPGR